MSKLYNEEIKIQYLDDYYTESEYTQYIVKLLFEKFSEYEDSLDKDIFSMSREQLRDVLEEIKPFSLTDARRKGQYLFHYISWAIENGYKEDNNLNPLLGVDDNFYLSTIDQRRKVHYTFKEVQDIAEDIANAQDQAMVMLMFYGISGDEFKELIGLNYDHIDWIKGIIHLNRKDRLTGEYKIVDLKVSDRLLYYLERAYQATTYYGFIGETSRKLVPSKYIMKNTVNHKTRSANPSMATIYSRIYRIKEYLDLEYFTSKSLQQSGMIYMAYDLIINQKKYPGLTRELYQEIGKFFNAAVVFNTKKEEYEYNASFISNVVNPEKIKELYNVNVERIYTRS